MLTTTPSPPLPLVTLPAMQTQLTPLVFPDDEVERRLLETSLAFASTHGLDRAPRIETYTERLPGRGGILLQLSRWPVVEVLELKVCDEVVEATEFEVVEERRDSLFLDARWPQSVRIPEAASTAGDRKLDIEVIYRAGWIVPDQVIVDLAPAQVIDEGHWFLAEGRLFEATTGGAVGSTLPVWPPEGETVQDGAVLWRALPAEIVPLDLQGAAVLHTRELLKGLHAPPPHVQRVGDSGGSVTLKDSGSFSNGVRAILERYR